jgi:hypothetical protein
VARFPFVLRAYEPKIEPPTIRRRQSMAASARKKNTKLFHATMQVLRMEEWCVEAESAEEARALLTSGAGHRCTPGESLHVEFGSLIDN